MAGTSSSRRFQLFAVCLALVLLVFSQASGSVAADTKLDLVVSPWRFLVHAMTMWNPLSDAGTPQNQAYGYLFPMGPFFVLGHLTRLPPWVVQRGWESALDVAAFLGTVRLARRLGMPGFWPRVAAGLAYALAPRMLTELGSISSELLPYVVAPWVLLPLVGAGKEGSPRRAAARSGLALLFAGGINAAATLAILPLPLLWLLTRKRGPRRAQLTRWWAGCTALACLWWAIPLLVLGRFAPPFLDYIESSAITTSQTSLATTLRGAEHWESYLGPGIWPAGWTFAASGVVVLATALVAALGIGGLVRRDTPHRPFLALAVAAGLVLVTVGHPGAVHPLAADWWRQALDGPLDAFRNVHKFDPVLRLPLAIGVGYATIAARGWLDRRQAQRTGWWRWLPLQPVALITAVWVSAIAAGPAFAGTVVGQPRLTPEPTWWSQAAAWLGQHAGGGRTLVVPGAAVPVYLWGATSDDALQPVAASPWSVRDSIPLAQPGYIRLLDEVETRLAAGRADPTLAAVLARSGIRYVLIRNDLDTNSAAATPLRFVHLTLAHSPGFTPAATFGPDLTRADPRRLVDLGATVPDGTITVYRDLEWRGMTELAPISDVVHANGSSDALPALTEAGIGPQRPVVFGALPAALAGAPIGTTILDDGVRKREFAFGNVDTAGGTFFRGQSYDDRRSVHDYLPSPAPPLSEYVAGGLRSVLASSSGASVSAVANRWQGNGPWSAVDGNRQTAWLPGALSGAVGQWLQVNLRDPVDLPAVHVRFAGRGRDLPDRIAVTTDTGRLVQGVAADTRVQPVDLPAGATRTIRITVLHVADGTSGPHVGIRDLVVPGVHPTRTLAVPAGGAPGRIAFTVESGKRTACLTVAATAACDPTWHRSGEEDGTLDRSFTLASGNDYRWRMSVQPRPGPDLDRVLDHGNPVRAIASSTQSLDPRERPGAAVDGNATTGWVASPSDRKPGLLLSIPMPRRLTGVRIRPIEGAPVARPTQVLITAGTEAVRRRLPPSGLVRFPSPARAASVAVQVLHWSLRSSTDSLTGATRLLPVGIGEVRLLGHRVPAGATGSRLHPGCGSGPRISVDGRTLRTRVTGSAAAALSGATLDVVPCTGAATMRLAAGGHRIVVPSSPMTVPQQLRLSTAPGFPPAAAGGLQTLHWGSTGRTVQVSSTGGPSLLVVHENNDAGWTATYAGRALPPVTVDGWQQGWVLPAGAAGPVQLRFTPQRTVTIGLIGGGAAALLLLSLALIRPRRRPLAAPLGDARWPRSLAAFLVGAALLLLGSWIGLAVAVACLALGGPLARRNHRWRLALAPALLVGVAGAAALEPVTAAHPLANTAAVQLTCLAAVGLLLAQALFETPPDEPPPQPATEG